MKFNVQRGRWNPNRTVMWPDGAPLCTIVGGSGEHFGVKFVAARIAELLTVHGLGAKDEPRYTVEYTGGEWGAGVWSRDGGCVCRCRNGSDARRIARMLSDAEASKS